MSDGSGQALANSIQEAIDAALTVGDVLSALTLSTILRDVRRRAVLQ
jgi:hypothetical protein